MHRSSVVPPPLRRRPDPAQSADPAIRELVAGLAELRIAPPADPRFRSELRTQLVAIAPRLVEEQLDHGTGDASAAAGSPASRRARGAGARHTGNTSGRRSARWHRPLAATASVLVVLGILLGITVWLSRDAIPGDALYGLKRTSERVQLYLASSETDRAKDYLQFAQRRTSEVKSLLHRDQAAAPGTGPAAAGVNAETTRLISQTLDTADSQTQDAMRLLGGLAARKKSAAPLDPMKIWTPSQYTRLRDLAEFAPTVAIRHRVDDSVTVLEQVWARTEALDTTASCTCSGSAGADRLGPRPCPPCATPATPRGPTGSSAPSGTVGSVGSGTAAGSRPATGAGGSTGARSGTGRVTGHVGGVPASSSPGGSAHPDGGAPPASTSTPRRLPLPVSSLPSLPSLPLPSVTVPHLPIPSVTVPGVGAGACQVTVEAGPLHVAVTVCPSPSKR